MKKIVLATLCFVSVIAHAQQQPLYSQYEHNAFVLNPAFAGTLGYTEIKTVFRSQWTGLEGGPQTSTLSFNTGWDDKKIGYGGYVFSDKLGPVTKTGINASYAYHAKVGKESMLSFGLSGLFYLYKLNTEELKFDAAGNSDLVLLTGDFKAYDPNVGFGMYYKNKRSFIGFSIPQLVPVKITASRDFFVVQEKQHYFLSTGTRLKMSDNVDLNPSLLFKYVNGAPAQLDASVNVNFKKVFYIGASYRSGAALVLLFGVNYKEEFSFGYSYDITTSGIGSYAKSSHEFMLCYNIKHKKPEEPKLPDENVPPPTEIK